MGNTTADLGVRSDGLAVETTDNFYRVPSRWHGDLVLASGIEVVPDARAFYVRHGPNGAFREIGAAGRRVHDADLGGNWPAGRIRQSTADDSRRPGIRLFATQAAGRKEQGACSKECDPFEQITAA
ncbi:MAG: hypothetical protein IPM24_09280 [Bryobacterales bacterium]|nr:hypothetical protein [Bryobacterales bacterium]